MRSGRKRRYALTVSRHGPANYRADLFVGDRLVTDAWGHTPAVAVRCAVEHCRYLRRIGWIREECA